MQIFPDSAVTFHFALTDDQGQELDNSKGHNPLVYLHGAGQLIPGLEKAMLGRCAGDQFKVTVPPDEAYGQHFSELVHEAPRSDFIGIKDILPGMQFEGRNEQGDVEGNVHVIKVEGDTITVDANHPLAGKTLQFDIEVVSVREATAEECQTGKIQPMIVSN